MLTTLSKAPSKTQVLGLYRQLLHNSQKFTNYNFREYFARKTKDTFAEKRSLSNEEEIINAYNQGVKDLSVLKRQAVISQMYTASKLVIERV